LIRTREARQKRNITNTITSMEGNNNKPKMSLKDLASQMKPKADETTAVPESTAVAPSHAPEGTAIAPERTATAPERTATAPERTATVPGRAAKPQGQTASGFTHQVGEDVAVGGHNCTITERLGNGTEGEIFKVKEGNKTYALKLCHPGFRTNKKVLDALQPLKGKDCIVDIEAYGDTFELMEFIEGKSAANTDFNFAADPKHEKKAQAILLIAYSIAMSFDKMHEANVLHKDVKPANILIKDRETWSCVLCDFGIADLLKTETKDGIMRKYCVTKRNRTPIYAAPEIYKEDNATMNDDGSISSEMTPKADFYSLGMTILSMWMGEKAFTRAEEENSLRKMKGTIDIPADIPDPLNRIVRGLLIKSPEKRWDFKSIDAYINGQDVPVEEDEILADLNIVYNASKHQTAHTFEDLTDFMAEDIALAARYLYKGQINKWLADYPELQARLDDIVEDRYRNDQNGGAVAAIYAIWTDRPFELDGSDKKTGEKLSCKAHTLKEVSDFYNRAEGSYDTNKSIESLKFTEWVRQRDAKLADALPGEHMLRIQTIDPLTFLCQIRCDEIAPYDNENLLPHEGMLYFFAALDYFLGNLDAISSPGMGEWEAPYFKVLYAPDCKELHTHRIVCEDGSPFGLPAESIRFTYESELECSIRLLGEPYIEDVREAMPGMLSLLQIDESDDWNLRFYDCGMLNFLISRDDLLNRRWQYIKCYLFSF